MSDLKNWTPRPFPERKVLQGPVKFQLVINLNAGKPVGLDVLSTLLARADEIIE